MTWNFSFVYNYLTQPGRHLYRSFLPLPLSHEEWHLCNAVTYLNPVTICKYFWVTSPACFSSLSDSLAIVWLFFSWQWFLIQYQTHQWNHHLCTDGRSLLSFIKWWHFIFLSLHNLCTYQLPGFIKCVHTFRFCTSLLFFLEPLLPITCL